MTIMLHVDNLSAQVTDSDLIATFGDHGTVESAAMDCASSTKTGKRSAAVLMANSEDAQAAIDWLHDTQFKGTRISVARALNDKQRRLWLHLDIPRS